MPLPNDPRWHAACAVADNLLLGHPLPERDLVALAIFEQWRDSGGSAGVFTPTGVYWVTVGEPPHIEPDPAASQELDDLLANHLAPPLLVPPILRSLTTRRYAYFVNDLDRLLVVRASPHRRRFLVEAADTDSDV